MTNRNCKACREIGARAVFCRHCAHHDGKACHLRKPFAFEVADDGFCDRGKFDPCKACRLQDRKRGMCFIWGCPTSGGCVQFDSDSKVVI